MDRYIGEKKIKSVEEGERIKVIFEDDTSKTFPARMYEASLTHELIDATKLQERRLLAVQAAFMQLLLDWDIKLSDFPVLLQWSNNYLNDKHERADEKLWGNTYRERTIGDLENTLSGKHN